MGLPGKHPGSGRERFFLWTLVLTGQLIENSPSEGCPKGLLNLQRR
jgi:hypothetical protein